MKLTAANTLILPEEWFSKAPTCFSKGLWFEKENLCDLSFDSKCEKAIIALGIGERECPTIGEWAAFTIAGAIVTTLTGKYIIPPRSTKYIENLIWEMLWKAVEENSDILHKKFIAAMLRTFLPRYHYAPPDRPYYKSFFVSDWSLYPDTITESIGNIRSKYLEKGREEFAFLPQGVKESILMVAKHVPIMLEIVVDHIRKTYHW